MGVTADRHMPLTETVVEDADLLQVVTAYTETKAEIAMVVLLERVWRERMITKTDRAHLTTLRSKE